MSVTDLSAWRNARDDAALTLRHSYSDVDAVRVGFVLSGRRPPTDDLIMQAFDLNPETDFVHHPTYKPSIIFLEAQGENWSRYPCILQLTPAKADIVKSLMREHVVAAGPAERSQLADRISEIRSENGEKWYLQKVLLPDNAVQEMVRDGARLKADPYRPDQTMQVYLERHAYR